jgi:transcriptional regulator with XRE-family HTH domain
MKLKQRLSEYRKASGISQEEAAEKLNVSRQTIGRWEQGRTIPSMENMAKLSELYNVPLENLVQDVYELHSPSNKKEALLQSEESVKLNSRKIAPPIILAMVILVVTVVVSVLFFQGQAEDSVSESELQGEVIDILPGKLDILPVE